MLKEFNEDETLRKAQERIRRAYIAREATAIVALSGFTFSPEQEADVEAFVRGELTPEEVTARTLARHAKSETDLSS